VVAFCNVNTIGAPDCSELAQGKGQLAYNSLASISTLVYFLLDIWVAPSCQDANFPSRSFFVGYKGFILCP
jgi:hypothetical protein